MLPVTETRKVCIHCGTPFRPTAHRPDFCCAGCQFVHDLIAKKASASSTICRKAACRRCNRSSFKSATTPGWKTSRASPTERSDARRARPLVHRLRVAHRKALHPETRRPSIRVDPTLGQLALRWQPGVFDPLAIRAGVANVRLPRRSARKIRSARKPRAESAPRPLRRAGDEHDALHAAALPRA